MSSYTLKMAERWRSTYNPLRGLTMPRVVSLLEAGERGDYADLQWAFRMIEKRDATLRGVVRKLNAALLKLDWDIRVPAVPSREDLATKNQLAAWRRNGLGYDAWQELAEAQRNALRAAYDQVSNLRAALGFLALAEFRGFSHLEKVADGQGRITRLEPVPQWHWCRDGIYGPWQFSAEAVSGRTSGEPVDLRRVIVREVDSPVDEIALIAFVRKSLSQKDWDGFVETYGIPALFGMLPQGTPASEMDKWQELMERVVGDARGCLPPGGDVKTVGDGVRGIQPFEGHIRYQDEQIVLAGTSGKLTMLTAASGMNSGQADAQADTFDEIAFAQAAQISEVMQSQFDAGVLGDLFPGAPQLAYFELASIEESDVDAEFTRAGAARSAGYKISAAELSEKTGYNLEEVEPAAPMSSGMVFNRFLDDEAAEGDPAPDGEPDREAVLDALEAAYQEDMSGVLDALQPQLDAYTAAATPEARKAALARLAAALDKLPVPEAEHTGELLSRVLGQEVLSGAGAAAKRFANQR